jgi:hypothetical protein
MNAPRIQLIFDFDLTADGMDKAQALLKYADTIGAETPSAPPPTPPKKGKTPAPAPAPAPKAASKANSKGKPAAKEPEQIDIMDLNLGDDDDEEETGGLGLGDDDDAADGFDGTPEEAKEEALAKLRVLLGSGLKEEVKKVQKIMQVAKFHDVPASQGYEFLKAVKDVEAKLAKN